MQSSADRNFYCLTIPWPAERVAEMEETTTYQGRERKIIE